MITLTKLTLSLVMALGITTASALADTSANKIKAVNLLELGLEEKNRDFINTYVNKNYIQHNPQVADGREGLLGFVDFLEAKVSNFSVKPVRVLAEDNLVAIHSKAEFFGSKIIIDIFRFENGKIAEHWDGIQEEVKETANGNTMIDGVTEIVDFDKTAANKELVIAMVKDVLMGGKLDKIDDYIAPAYKQHNPFVGDTRDGLKQFIKYLGDNNISFGYTKLHNVVAEGNFVVTQAEGIYNDKPTAFYDIWRVENGKIAEHWDVVQEIPAEFAHTNGMF